MKTRHCICASVILLTTTLFAAAPALAKDVAIAQETVRVRGLHAPAEEVARRALPRLEGAWRIVPGEVVRPPHLRCRVDRLGTHSVHG